MPASDVFPRRVTVSGKTIGNLFLSLPACAGISWVLTAFDLLIVSLGGTSHGADVTTNLANLPVLGSCFIPSNGVVTQSATFSWSGEVDAPMVTPITIGFNTNDINVQAYATMEGYAK